MESPQSFREFESVGWNNTDVCSTYDQQISLITKQSVDALLDATRVQNGMRVLDVATGAGYAAVAAAARGAVATGIDFSASQVALARHQNPKLTFE